MFLLLLLWSALFGLVTAMTAHALMLQNWPYAVAGLVASSISFSIARANYPRNEK